MIQIDVLASSSAGNCYLVDDGATKILLECGIPIADIRRELGFGLTQVAAVLVSHEHGDHARAIEDVLRSSVDVYASLGTLVARRISHHRAHAVMARSEFTVGTWVVLPFEAVHDAAEPLGFLMASSRGAKLLYLTDSAYCRYRFEGLTHLLVEANHSRERLREGVRSGDLREAHVHRLMRNHMSIERLLDMLAANDLSRVQAIHLLHLSDQNADEQQFKAAVARATGKPVYVAARRREVPMHD